MKVSRKGVLTEGQMGEIKKLGQAWRASTTDAERERYHKMANDIRTKAGLTLGKDSNETTGQLTASYEKKAKKRHEKIRAKEGYAFTKTKNAPYVNSDWSTTKRTLEKGEGKTEEYEKLKTYDANFPSKKSSGEAMIKKAVKEYKNSK